MANFKITGTITDIKDEQQITERFSKREVWVELPGKKDQTISIEFYNDKANILDDHSIGDAVEITFSLRGRIYNNRCYTTLAGSEITLVMGTQSKPKPKKTAVKKQWTPPIEKEAGPLPDGFINNTPLPEVDDLPF